jgi:hypothetical protein
VTARRVLLAALLGPALLAAPADAALSDRFVPYRDAADGVIIADDGPGLSLRLGPAAAGDYRRLAGRRVLAECWDLAPGGIGVGTIDRAPKRRSRFSADLLGPADVCTLATAGRTRRPGCALKTEVSPWRDFCVRMVIARTEAGRTRVDEVARAFDIVVVMSFAQPYAPAVAWAPAADVVAAMDGDVVAMDGPAATPPPGVVGYWTDGTTATAVTVTAAGLRRYLTIGPDERSTNARGLLQLGVPQIG